MPRRRRRCTSSPGTPSGHCAPRRIQHAHAAVGDRDGRSEMPRADRRRARTSTTPWFRSGRNVPDFAATLRAALRARSTESGSPPDTARNPAWPRQPESSRIRQPAGVAWSMVAAERSMTLRSAAPSRTSSWLAITISAPALSGSINSSTAMSNDSVVTATSRSSSWMPGSLLQRSQQIRSGAMRHAHAFRLAGRTGSEDHVGDVLRRIAIRIARGGASPAPARARPHRGRATACDRRGMRCSRARRR